MPMSEHEAPPANASAAPAANPAAGAAPATPAPGAPAGEQNEQMNMAAIGQALKHIAELLTNIHAKIGGAEPAAPAAAEPGALDNEEVPEGKEQAEDITLEPAAQELSINGSGDGDLPAEKLGGPGNQGSQEGTPARGNPTPHGAMDAAGVKKAIAAAVATERSRAAAVTAAAREVRGVLGDVYGMDDAGAIYREALKVVGVDVSGVPAGAEKVAWQAYKSVRTVAAGAQHRTDASHALDADAAAAARKGITANLAKITILG